MLTLYRAYSVTSFKSSVKNSALKIVCNRLYSTTLDDKNKYDIIVAGGGMVGTTLACTLGTFLHFQTTETPLHFYFEF